MACIGSAMGEISRIRLEHDLHHRQKALLGRGLSVRMLEDMDKDGEGVDRSEFVCAILLQLGKISESDIGALFEKFEELDADRSGVLTKEDLALLRGPAMDKRHLAIKLQAPDKRVREHAADMFGKLGTLAGEAEIE